MANPAPTVSLKGYAPDTTFLVYEIRNIAYITQKSVSPFQLDQLRSLRHRKLNNKMIEFLKRFRPVRYKEFKKRVRTREKDLDRSIGHIQTIRKKLGGAKMESTGHDAENVSRLLAKPLVEDAATVEPAIATPTKEIKASDDPVKLKAAQEQMAARKAAKVEADQLVGVIAKRLKKAYPPGTTFQSKVKHCVAVQRAVDSISMYDAMDRYCKKLGIDRPSSMGIYEAAGRIDYDAQVKKITGMCKKIVGGSKKFAAEQKQASGSHQFNDLAKVVKDLGDVVKFLGA